MKHQLRSILISKRQRLILVGAGVIILVLIFCLTQARQRSRPALRTHVLPIPRVATALLSLQQETATSTAVLLDTGSRAVTAVQFGISFDPSVVHNLRVTPGTFFRRGRTLVSLDSHAGSLFVVIIPPSNQPKRGKGIVARLSYVIAQGVKSSVKLQFLPTTKVTTAGIDSSILKRATGIAVHPPE